MALQKNKDLLMEELEKEFKRTPLKPPSRYDSLRLSGGYQKETTKTTPRAS